MAKCIDGSEYGYVPSVGIEAPTMHIPPKLKSPYDCTYKGIKLDPYRILEVYGITHPAQQHAIKKLLRAGKSVKNLKTDIEEIIATLNRWLCMLEE